VPARITTQLLLILYKFAAMWPTGRMIVLSGKPNKLALSIGKQIQQSGLLPQLQRLLSDAAERLEAALPPAPIYSHTASMQAAGDASSSSSSSSSNNSAADRLTAEQHDQLQQETLALLSLYSCLQCFWPNTVFAADVVPECAAPMMRLVCLSAQYTSSLLATSAAGPAGRSWGLSNFSEQLWQQSTTWLMGSQVAMAVLNTAYFWTGQPAANSHQLKQQLGMYTSAHYLPCIVLMMACHAYSSLLLQLPALPRAGTSDSAANSSRGQRSQAAGPASLPMESPAHMAKLWKFAQDQQQVLPASHRRLFQLLGLDSTTVVWLGAVLAGNILEVPSYSMAERNGMASGRLGQMVSQFLQLRELHTDPEYQHAAVRKALLSKPALAWQQEQQLHYLLPSLLLYWTAGQPAQQPGGGQPASPYLAVSCSLSALRAARKDLSRASFADQQYKKPGQQSTDSVWHSPSVNLQLLLTRDVLPLAVATGLKLVTLLPADGSSGKSTAAAAAGSHPLASAQLTDTQAAAGNIISILSSLALASNMRFMTQSQMDTMPVGSTSSTAGASTALAGGTSSSTASGSTGSSTGVSADSTSIYAPAAVTEVWAPHATAVGRIAEAYVRNVALRGMAWASAERELLPKMSQLFSFTQGYTLSPLLQAAVTAESGSPEQLQLFSLLLTWGKAGQGLEGVNQCFRVVLAMLQLSVTARESPEDTTRQHVWQRTVDPELSRAMGLPEVGSDGSSSSAAAAPGAMGGAGANGALAMVPWLVLFGRSLRDCSQLLLAEARKLRMMGSMGGLGALADPVLQLQANLAAEQEDQGGPNEMLTVPAECMGHLSICSSVCQLAQQWLEAPGRLLLLSTAGLCEMRLSVHIVSLLGSVESLEHLEGSAPLHRVTVSKGTLQQLEQLGEALNSLAMPYACNNPLCRNLSGPTELELVGSRSCKCSGCRTACYCGKECQRQHWKQHKPVCKAIGAYKSSTASRS
jgi:hypothetical protein